MLRTYVDKIRSTAAGVFAWTLIGSFLGVVLIVSLALTPFYMLFQWLFGFGPKLPDPKVVEEVERVYRALEEGDLPFLKDFAKSNADFPHGKDGFLQQQWLTNAIDHGSLDSVQWFLDQGVDVNYQEGDGSSPLKSAIQRDCVDAVTGLDPSLAIPIITLLLDAGANINARGTLDVTPLHTAAGFGVSLELMQFLLDRGANPLAQDSDHGFDTPLGYVNKRKQSDIAALLKKHMEIWQDMSTEEHPD